MQTIAPSQYQVSEEEYRLRRSRFAKRLGKRAIAIIPAARLRKRNSDVNYPFRQDSDFRYLCNFPEEDALLVMAPGRSSGEFILFCNDRHPVKELWDGPRLGPKGACAETGADEAHRLTLIDEIMPDVLLGRDDVYCSLNCEVWIHERLRNWLQALHARTRAGVRTPSNIANLDENLHEMRLIKSDREIEIMRAAGEITMNAHGRAMEACAAGGYEYQLEAELHYEFCKNGGRQSAYPSIVGSGKNTCVLHYLDNESRLTSGDMVLIDAGCELNGYASDITRSFPVDGQFTKEQAAFYDVVAAAQQAAIAAAKPNNTILDVHESAVQVLVQGMIDLGLLKGTRKKLLEGDAWHQFYPHRTSHWLGMDVHDVGAYVEPDGSPRLLKAGMVLTIEPGLYVPPSISKAPAALRGTGVRIEDDILVSNKGPVIINPDTLRERSDIEERMGKHGSR